MNWWGKLIGGAFGYMMGGPLGALLGAALGHHFDKGIKGLGEGPSAVWGEQERTQTAFFTATFSVMGHLAKADGRVSRHEIDYAERVMRQMDLDAEQRQLAINLFNEGKQPGFILDDVLEQFRRECHRRHTLIQMFLEIQLQAALADSVLDPEEEQVLRHVFVRLGFSQAEFARLVAMVTAASHFSSDEQAHYAPRRSDADLVEAYQLLGVDSSASDAEVKKAYRRLMNQHHPDKLVAKGLPEEMIKLATEKVQEIRAAYDTVKQARGMR